jgi:hypothetical protein
MTAARSRPHPVASAFTGRFRGRYGPDALVWAMLSIGCVLRLRWYLFDRSLWWDEAALAGNFLWKPWPALLGRLDNNQAAPFGFLLAERALASMFGDGERILRLLPLICGIATLPLFYVVTKSYARARVVPFAVGLFVISSTQVYYASECKPYMIDLALTLLMLQAGVWMSTGALTTPRAAGVGLLGATAVWCSYPISFVLAGVAMGSGVESVRARDWPRLTRIAAIAGVWLSSFVACYLTSLRTVVANPFLKSYWASGFLSLADLHKTYRLLVSVFVSPTDVISISRHAVLLVPIFAIGSAVLLARSRSRWCMLFLPLLFAGAASVAGVYPFYDRLLLFMVPLVLLPTIEGIVQLGEWVARMRPAAGRLATAALVLGLSVTSLVSLWDGPKDNSEVRSLVADLGKNAAPDDVIYVGEFAPVYEYYRGRFGLGNRAYVPGPYFDGEWDRASAAVLDALRGRPRVWVITNWPQVPQHLDAIGKRLAETRARGAVLYLYDLTAYSR